MSMGLKANADGSGAIQVGGSDAITITSGLVVSMNGGVGGLVSGTAVASTSGTSIDFLAIPAWVKRITVMFNGVSTNGTSNPIVQIGSTTFTATGYLGSAGVYQNSANPTLAAFTTGFGIISSTAAATVFHGILTINLITGNSWIASGNFATSSAAVTATSAGSVTLAGVLDRVRITTTNGTDTFDAGSINILYE